MKKTTTLIIIAIIAVITIWTVWGYNDLVSMDENVSSQWANVETQYQRRADLIPNLVNTVKGYAAHEQETLKGVVEARSKATQIKLDASELTPEKLAQFQQAQGELTTALNKLLAIREAYPDLKANQNFLDSWKARRTASTWRARTSTTPQRIITPPSAASPRISWPECSASTSAPTSKHRRVPRWLRRWNSDVVSPPW